MSSPRIIIVGGGLSGLYTALLLQQADIPYLLLEAKATLGGRMECQAIPDSPNTFVDLGPTWYWPHQQKIQQLVLRLGLNSFEQYTRGDALYQIQADQPPVRSSGAGTMTSYRIKGGMYQLIMALVERLDSKQIKTTHSVTSINYLNQTWHIDVIHQGSQKQITTNQLILALPPRLIMEYLTPEKWASHKLIDAFKVQQTWMSAQAKFIAVYKTPFWRHQGLAGDAFSQVGPMSEIHDASADNDGNYALFGFIGYSAADRKRLSVDQLQDKCLQQLEALFGVDALNIKASYLKDWSLDEWVTTTQDINEISRHAEFNMHQHENELHSLNLYLGGSEFSNTDPGYLEGALTAASVAVDRIKDIEIS